MLICLTLVTTISCFLIEIAIIAKQYYCKYNTIYCRGDIRAELGIFAYTSDVEEARRKLKKEDIF